MHITWTVTLYISVVLRNGYTYNKSIRKFFNNRKYLQEYAKVYLDEHRKVILSYSQVVLGRKGVTTTADVDN